jgi:hypothetical protein
LIFLGGRGAGGNIKSRAGCREYRLSANFIKNLAERFKGWEEDLIFKGGLGAGRKSNPGGLPVITVIGKVR